MENVSSFVRRQRDLLTAVLMGFTAGYTTSNTKVRFNTFGGMMTGNTVVRLDTCHLLCSNLRHSSALLTCTNHHPTSMLRRNSVSPCNRASGTGLAFTLLAFFFDIFKCAIH